jgi:putative ABC transport system permease protein
VAELLNALHALWIDLRLALRNLLRQPRRTTIAISAITGGIIALLLANGFIEWIFQDMRESTIHAHLGHIEVVRPGWIENGRSDPLAYLLPESGAALDTVRRMPGIETVAPRLYFSGLVSQGETTVSFVADGVDPAREAGLARGLTITAGEQLKAGDATGALLGVGLANNLAAKPGDQVVVLVNKPNGGVNAVELTVRGLFSTISKAYDDAALRLPIATAQRLLGVHGAQTWVVLLKDTDATAAAVKWLRERLPAAQFQALPWFDLADFYNKTVALFTRQIAVVRVIIAAIIVLSISNTMTMTVIERTGEIGTAMALGVRRRRILSQFLAEGALLGALGGVAGIMLGALLAAIISAIGIPMPAPPGMAHGYVGEIRLTWPMVASALGLAVGTTLLASAYPAWKASRLAIVDALRHQR